MRSLRTAQENSGFMFGPGFLGTRAGFMMDVVAVSLCLIVPSMIWSFRKARAREFATHRNIQTVLGIVLLIAVTLFEMEMRHAGGIFQIAKGSALFGSAFFIVSIYGHMVFSISTALLWAILIPLSLLKFRNNTLPDSFKKFHRYTGRVAMIDMLLTAVTGIEVYVIAFIF